MIFRIGLIFSISLGRKCASDVRRPTNGWISFRFLGLLISAMEAHLSGLASMPWAVNMNPRNLPADTPNTHFSGLRRMLYLRTWWKTSFRSRTWSSAFCQLRQEARKGCQTPDQPLDLLQIFGTSHLGNGGALVRIDLDTLGGQHEPQEFAGRHSEHAFLTVETHVVLAHLVKDLF